MKLKLFFGAFNAIALFSVSAITAQNFQQMPISSGLTADVIANGVGPSLNSTTMTVDGGEFALVSRDFQATASSTPLTYGLPVDGVINTVVAATPGLSYKLADYNSNNSLRLSNGNSSGTLVFAAPKAAFKLYMLATSGGGASTVNITVNFTDTTSQTFSNINVSDWYGGTGFAMQGFGRINRTTDALESGSLNPRLYQTQLTIDPANQNKPIQSVLVDKVSTNQEVTNVFAFSADAYTDCMAPTLQPVSAITVNSANVSWTVPAGTAAVNYDIYYSTSNTPPTGTTTPNLPGITGTSAAITGLNPSTVYYYWVRTNCSSATSQSVWSFSGTFKTACGAITSMFENFDSYATGNIVPDCWIRLAGTGTLFISSSTPASGTRNMYQLTTTTATPSYAILPVFSNVNSGTNQLRFKAKVTIGAPGSLIVGYVTNVSDASTFVALQTVTINNTSYTSNSEYIVPVPNTVPAGARLAIRSANDGKAYYWDDVYWEANTLATSEVDANKKKLMIHPNPFKDVLYISEIEKVTSVIISDVSGRVIRTIDNPTKAIDLNLLNSGLYLVNLRLKDGTQYTVKAIKK